MTETTPNAENNNPKSSEVSLAECRTYLSGLVKKIWESNAFERLYWSILITFAVSIIKDTATSNGFTQIPNTNIVNQVATTISLE